ncbi:hypothetical protein HO133_001053 [Letharia lupina]|uniref:Rhodopsin domain-containing protein n=1 Tax=Letharia lupina TaxID=560253 RepID=A0A8H6CGG6_9LECA|nr:uncharacterized protein HO133_001053 [Letharia lupina]KAF6223002.1 hypothetical protein HO133_001053 [Letharia lupina]
MSHSFCDENQGTIGLAFTWILLSFGILTVSLRIYVRSGVNGKIGWDDYTAVASLVSTPSYLRFAFTSVVARFPNRMKDKWLTLALIQAVGILAGGFFTKMITSGMGRHVSCLPPQSVIAMLEFSAISEALNVFGIGVVKISVCLALLRVVERARRGITLFLRSLLVFVAVTHLALALLFFLHCRPLAALWNPKVQGSCLSTHTTVLAGYVGFAVDVVTDLVCAGIPVLVIHRLQMSFRTKVALCVLMGLGVFTAGCAVAKAITLRGVFADDYTFGFTKPATWAAVEQFVGIIITSIPALRPLLRSFLEQSHNRSGIRRYIFWGSKTGSFGFGKKGSPQQQEQQQQQYQQQKQQQVSRSESSVQESVRTKNTFLPWHRDSRGLPFSSSDSNQATAVYKESSKGGTGQVDPEKVLLGDRFGDRFGDVVGRDYLKGWSLPDIADRRSAMIAIPVFDV